MAPGDSHREIEIKLPLPDADEGRRLLEEAGLHPASPRVLQHDIVFDTADRKLSLAGSLLRVRQTGSLGLLTFKGPAEYGKHKAREELEIELPEPATAAAILERLGFESVFRYEKYRTPFAGPEPDGLVTLDETPIGDFLELEGSPEWIDRTAARLGFTESDYITVSYAHLYRDHCRARGLEPGDMVFPAQA